MHGYLDRTVHHLYTAGLVSSDGCWTGGTAHLWFTGDFTDRGPDGIGALEFIMRLQQDAARQGGLVGALLGNHDIGIVSAYRFPDAPTGGPKGTFKQDWMANGGNVAELERLEARHVEWLQSLPAVALEGDRLLVHADAMFYLEFGNTVARVNAALTDLLASADTQKWDQLLGYAAERFAFDERRAGGVLRVRQFLATYGGSQIIHGHTPIPYLCDQPIERVTHAHVYADGLAVDVDGGMYKGGPGLVYHAVPMDLRISR